MKKPILGIGMALTIVFNVLGTIQAKTLPDYVPKTVSYDIEKEAATKQYTTDLTVYVGSVDYTNDGKLINKNAYSVAELPEFDGDYNRHIVAVKGLSELGDYSAGLGDLPSSETGTPYVTLAAPNGVTGSATITSNNEYVKVEKNTLTWKESGYMDGVMTLEGSYELTIKAPFELIDYVTTSSKESSLFGKSHKVVCQTKDKSIKYNIYCNDIATDIRIDAPSISSSKTSDVEIIYNGSNRFVKSIHEKIKVTSPFIDKVNITVEKNGEYITDLNNLMTVKVVDTVTGNNRTQKISADYDFADYKDLKTIYKYPTVYDKGLAFYDGQFTSSEPSYTLGNDKEHAGYTAQYQFKIYAGRDRVKGIIQGYPVMTTNDYSNYLSKQEDGFANQYAPLEGEYTFANAYQELLEHLLSLQTADVTNANYKKEMLTDMEWDGVHGCDGFSDDVFHTTDRTINKKTNTFTSGPDENYVLYGYKLAIADNGTDICIYPFNESRAEDGNNNYVLNIYADHDGDDSRYTNNAYIFAYKLMKDYGYTAHFVALNMKSFDINIDETKLQELYDSVQNKTDNIRKSGTIFFFNTNSEPSKLPYIEDSGVVNEFTIPLPR